MGFNEQDELKICDFARQRLGFKDCTVLEVFQGYLVGGLVDKKGRCFWINKQNIEGLVEVAKIVALESTFSALLSFIPGGSFAYRLIKDQVGYPPRYNMIYEPRFYEIVYQTLFFDTKGQPQGIVDGLIRGIDQLSDMALKTGNKIQETLKGVFSGSEKENPRPDDDTKKEKSQRYGVLILSFIDRTSLVRKQIIEERLDKTKSTPAKLIKSAGAGLIPAVVSSYKTTEIDEAAIFLKSLRKIGFSIKFERIF
ncbi:MAG: hypothetical protein ACFFE8_02425 [Candidatus Heimdallarchaeota archaeon]